MRRLLFIGLIFTVWALLSCTSNNNARIVKQDSAAKSNPSQKIESAAASYFVPNQSDNPKNNFLFVFVGEKIELTRLPQEPIALDAAFLAKYKVLDKVYGDYREDTIDFVVYDHYGEPPFSKYKFVLLFVSLHEDKFYHEKYQYFDLYKTKEGKWASPYATGDYQHEDNQNTLVKPEKIEFADDVYYDVSTKKRMDIKEWYPAPYYQVARGKAKAVYGNYLPELFKLKRDGVLKARDLF